MADNYFLGVFKAVDGMPKSKKVIIVRPKLPVYDSHESCLTLLYLGTVLKKSGYAPILVDAQHDNAEKMIERHIGNALCVGISAMTVHVKHGLELTKLAKSLNPKIPVVWGGVHPTLMPRQTLFHPDIDYIVIGEGELSFLELVKYIGGSGKSSISNIAGIGFKQNGKIVINETGKAVDLNSLSPPAFDLLDVERYIYDDPEVGERCMNINTGRGCVYNCTFCINTILKDLRWRAVTADNIINEIRLLRERYGIKSVRFTDENFFIDRRRVKEFCEKYIESGIGLPWVAFGRADYFNERHINDELLSLMKKSGCKTMRLGVESGSQRVLDMIRKGITPEQTIFAVKKLREYGIRPLCMFMIGMPGEQKHDMVETINLIKRLKDANPGTLVVGPQIFRPYPGSEMYNSLKDYGYMEPDTLEGWAGKGSKKDVMFSDFVNLDDLPWVKEKDFIEGLLLYMSIMQFNPNLTKSRLKKIAAAAFKKIISLRLALGFYSFQVDKAVYNWLQGAYRKHIVRA